MTAQITGRRAVGSAQVQIRLSAAELSAVDSARGELTRPAYITRVLMAALATYSPVSPHRMQSP